jgi:subfamily B ATP-binding cassette protein MsbA
VNAYRRLLRYLRSYRGPIAMAILGMFFLALTSGFSLSMAVPVLNMFFYQSAGITPEAPQKQVDGARDMTAKLYNLAARAKWEVYRWVFQADRFNVIRRLGLIILVLFLLKGLADYGRGYYTVVVEQGVVKDIRDDLFRHVSDLSLSYFHQRRSGQIISRFTNDVNLVRGAVTEGLASLVKEGLLVVVYLSIAVFLSWRLALMCLAAIALYSGIITLIGWRLRKRSHRIQERMADLTSDLQETVTGIRIVKAFAMEATEIAKFARHTADYVTAVLRFEKLGMIGPPLVEVLGAVVALPVLLFFGGHEIFVAKTLTPARLILFVGAALSLMQPIKRLSQVNSTMQQGVAAAERIFRMMDTRPEVQELPEAREVCCLKQAIRFKAVAFAYGEGHNALEDINLEVKAGEVVALVGPSGGGKSTLVDLIPRFYDPTSGCVEMDGVDLKRLKLGSLRRLIGMVTQETILFNTTVRENIAYGKPEAGMEEIIAAASAANAHGFISEMPEGYETMIGERGAKLSGGERHRLAIARAILKNPPILIFDEATSALDSESEKLVQEAIDRLLSGRTVIVIAHRLSTVAKADRIVVLEGGRIVEEGKHEELIQREGSLYKKLYEMQFGWDKEGKPEERTEA